MKLLNHIFKRILLYSFFISFVQPYCYGYSSNLPNPAVDFTNQAFDVATKASVDNPVIDEAIKTEVGEGAKGVLGDALAYVGVAYQIYSIVKEIKSHNFPNQEEKKHAEEIAKQYAFLSSRKGLRECLRDNRSTPNRMDSGLPMACKEIADLLLMFGGKEELNRVTAIYNEYRKSMG